MDNTTTNNTSTATTTSTAIVTQEEVIDNSCQETTTPVESTSNHTTESDSENCDCLVNCGLSNEDDRFYIICKLNSISSQNAMSNGLNQTTGSGYTFVNGTNENLYTFNSRQIFGH